MMRTCLRLRGLFALPLFLLLSAPVGAAPRSAYAHPEMLVDTGWLARHLHDVNLRIVDMRAGRAYEEGHIPGAVRLEEGPLRNAEDRLTYLPAPESLAAMMGKAGVGRRIRVIAYDDQGGKMAARLWYVLNAYGYRRVALLNGGWLKWKAEGRDVSTDAPGVAPTEFVPRASPSLTCPSDQLLARTPGVVVLDVRSPEEYAGTRASPGAARAGHIPGAVNVDWQENVEGPYLTFKSADDLKRLYEAKGITPEKQIVTQCASGGRAAQSLFTLRLLGYPHVRVYYGSFNDYSARPDAPVEK